MLEETLRIAHLCTFSLDELRYEYPDELVPDGHTPTTYLRQETYIGAHRRWPGGVPHQVQLQIEHELALIGDLRYEPYFLTVYDIVRFARSEGILCQGRGSAANSAVCFALGVTEVDPARSSMLFERFISKERGEPPDIDVDFEHQRREEVVQYIYRKYGRDRAALTAAVTTYRPRSALREAGKALGVDPAIVDRVAKAHQWFDSSRDLLTRFTEAGLDPGSPLIVQWANFAALLVGFPRHLLQHSGGFVISRSKLSRLVPIENPAMADRSIIQWDGRYRGAWPAEDRRARTGHAVGHPSRTRHHFRKTWRAIRAAGHSCRRSRHLRDDLSLRYGRRIPDRIARADEHAAPSAAALLLRSSDRGGDRASGPGTGRHGASLPAPAAGTGARHLSESADGAGALAHARRTDLPGAGDAGRDARGRIQPARPTSCVARWPHGAARADSKPTTTVS
ncbi:hypothetical protein J2797_005535 [Paraburkholderia terricola]|nr:hypothetical protein [Paraburkholderia terricola]